MADKLYKVGETTYNIPDKESASFLTDYPNAVALETFTIEKDTFDIPIADRELFLKDNPTAKPLKKKSFLFWVKWLRGGI